MWKGRPRDVSLELLVRETWAGVARPYRRKLQCRVRRRFVFFFQAEDGIRDVAVTGVQTCALPISDGQEIPEGFSASFQVMDRGQCRDHGVEKAFRYLLAVSRGDGIGIHMDTHVPDRKSVV